MRVRVEQPPRIDDGDGAVRATRDKLIDKLRGALAVHLGEGEGEGEGEGDGCRTSCVRALAAHRPLGKQRRGHQHVGGIATGVLAHRRAEAARELHLVWGGGARW